MELLAYRSTASDAVDGSDVFAIVAVSARNNVEDKLTGVLLFKDGEFLQIIEGPSAAIDILMDRVGRDNRHSNIRTIARTPIVQRIFPSWNMKRVYNLAPKSDADELREILIGLDISDEFTSEVRTFFDGDQKQAA